MILIVGSLAQLVSQTTDVLGTLLHASRDVLHLVGLQTVKTDSKYLSEATDNIKRCTYLVIHEVDELRLTTVGVEFKLIGLSQLRVERGELGIGVADVVDRSGKRLLHEDEAVGQSSHTVVARTLWQKLVEMPLGNAMGLFVEFL